MEVTSGGELKWTRTGHWRQEPWTEGLRAMESAMFAKDGERVGGQDRGRGEQQKGRSADSAVSPRDTPTTSSPPHHPPLSPRHPPHPHSLPSSTSLLLVATASSINFASFLAHCSSYLSPSLQSFSPPSSIMSGSIPQFKWAEDGERIFLTIELQSATDVAVQLAPSHFTFHAKSGSPPTPYSLDFELPKSIDPSASTWSVKGRQVEVVLVKAEDSQGWWNVLLKDKNLYKGRVKIDWDLWRDEDEEKALPDDFGGMGGGMGGMPGMGGMGGMVRATTPPHSHAPALLLEGLC